MTTTRKGQPNNESLASEIALLRGDLCSKIDSLQDEIRGLREALTEKDAKINRLEKRVLAMEETAIMSEVKSQDRDAAVRKEEAVIWQLKEQISRDPSPKALVKAISTSCQMDMKEDDIQVVMDKRGASGKGPIIVKFKSFKKRLSFLNALKIVTTYVETHCPKKCRILRKGPTL